MKTLRFEKKDKKFGYSIYLPEGYTESKKYPLIVALHGAGERGNGKDELWYVEKIGICKSVKLGLFDGECIIFAPQCNHPYVWNQQVFALKELIDEIIAGYSVDENKVSVTGMSMGGFGTWEMALTYPEMFSAIAPVCGGGMAWRVPALKGMPIWAFHGDNDATVNISNSVEMVNAARNYSSQVKFTVFTNVGHNSWDSAYLDTNVIDWLLSHDRRKRFEK